MKKKLSLLGIVLLCSSVLATTPTLNAIVHAEGTDQETTTPTESTSEEPTTPETPTIPEEPITPEAPTTSETPPTPEEPTTPEVPATPEEPTMPEEEAPVTINAVREQLQALIDEATTYLNYEKYNNEILYYLENYIINAKAALADSDATIEELQDYIDVLTTALNYVKDATNDRDQATKITIDVVDQTMHVGDVITPEMVLGWATVNNADGLYLEAEVVGAPIMINSLTNQLVQAGTYTIRYTVKSVDVNGNPLQATASGIDPQMIASSKNITLTVLDNGLVQEPVTQAPTEPLAPTASAADPVNPMVVSTKAATADPEKNLPETGEKNSPLLVALGGISLLAGAFILNKKRIEDQ